MRSLRSNRSGIIYVWVICFMAIVIYSIFWFIGGYVAISVIDAVTASYNFTGMAATTIRIIKNVLFWHPLFFMFGMLLWAFTNSRKREHVSWED